MSVLSGGRRRRRLGQRLALLALVMAPLAVGAAVYLGLVRDEPGDEPRTAASAPAAITPAAGGALEPRSPAPVRLSGVDAYRLRFRKPPRAALVFDVANGEVLFRRQPLRVLPMASLTKIMTALVVVDEVGPRERVRVTRAALRYSGSGVGVLPKGKRVRAEALLNGVMLVSGNDAAIALAVHVSGRERRFVALMNEKARLWGCAALASRRRTGWRTATARARPTWRCSPGWRCESRGLRASPAAARARSHSRSRAAACSWPATTH